MVCKSQHRESREKTTCCSLAFFFCVCFFCFCHDSRTNIIFTDHFIELHHQIGRGGRLICRTLTQSCSPLHQPHLHTALNIVTKKLLFCSDRKGQLVKSFLDVYDVMDAYYYCVKVTMLQLKKIIM